MKLKTTILFFLIVCTGTLMGNINFRNTDKTGIEKEVVIYPNPVINGSVSVETGEEFQKIEIVSIVGQTVFSEELEPSISAQLILNKVEKGIYLMRITYTDNTTITKRIWVK